MARVRPGMKSIRERIYEVAASVFGIPIERLDPYAPWPVLVTDSEEVVEFVMAIEEAFEITFEDEESNSMKCLDDLVRAVERHLGEDGIGVRVPL